jgi:hypothetical protein
MFRMLIRCFDNGVAAGVTASDIRGSFSGFITDPGPGVWLVRYDDHNYSEVHIWTLDPEAARVTAMKLEGVCSAAKFGDDLLAILKLGNLVLLLSTSKSPVVAGESVAAHLPPEMKAALGEVVHVTSGNEIMKLLLSQPA